jgi:serine/threonine-protein kinase
MADNSRVFGLLEEMLVSGVTPEEVCRDCPELLPEVRQRWKQLGPIDAEFGALFPEPEAIRCGDPVTPGQLAAGLPQVPGYEVEAVLGHGGMGVVYKAHHLRLNRPVALKMLLAGPYALPEELRRFLREAEAVAGLRHPNIVQVYDSGELNGRPYFVMEFVEGGSLAKRLAGHVLPPRDAARLAEALAEAMHLAHSRNLIHRDLKPANVLLAGGTDTPISECQPKVTDFGLVRQLDADSGQTRVGVVLGTPSYMAPEQAEGRAHAAGPAADVYALGAILYECLTGRPPFVGTTPLETLEQVRNHQPAAPSSLNRRVPRDLETICLKCLRKQPEQRYSSARELADDLRRFVRGEPVAARPVGAAERVRKWVQRRPTAAGLLAAVVLLVAVVGTGAWLFYQQQAAARARQAETDQSFRAVLERERGLLEEAWLAHDLAKLTAATAEGNRAVDIARSSGASAAVQQEAEAFREDATRRLDRAQKNRALLEAILDVSAPQETSAYHRDEASRMLVLAQPNVDEQYAAAFLRWGLDVDRTAEVEAAERLGREPEVVVQDLIAGLDAWMLERWRKRPEAEWQRLFRVADRLDRSERHRRLRALLVGRSPPRPESVASLVAAGSPWSALWELAHGNTWRQLLEVRGEIDPRTEPVLTAVLLAEAFVSVRDFARAEAVLHQAVTVRPNEVVLLNALGRLLDRQRPSRLGEAIGYCQAARVRRPSLGVALSWALDRDGRPKQAEKVLQELAFLQPDNPAVLFYLGVNLGFQQKLGEAAVAFRSAIALEPNNADARYNLGVCLQKQGKYGEAEVATRESIALKPNRAEAHNNLGFTLLCQHRFGEAEAACRRAIALQPKYVVAHNNLGLSLIGQHRFGEAEAAWRRAIALNPNYALAHYNLGEALFTQQRYDEAEAACRRAIALNPDFALSYHILGAALHEQGRFGEAEAACRRAIALNPDYALAHYNLGEALFTQQRYDEAEAASRRAIALNPDYAFSYHILGVALHGQGRDGEAEAAFRKAIALKPDHANTHYRLGNALSAQQKHAEAEAAYRRAIALKPDDAQVYNNLGMALTLKRYDLY